MTHFALPFSAYASCAPGYRKTSFEQWRLTRYPAYREIEPGDGQSICLHDAARSRSTSGTGYERVDVPGLGGSGGAGLVVREQAKSRQNSGSGRFDATRKCGDAGLGIIKIDPHFSLCRRSLGHEGLVKASDSEDSRSIHLLRKQKQIYAPTWAAFAKWRADILGA